MTLIRTKNRATRRLSMESLEERRLMAANLMAQLNTNGLLYIEGTERSDTIVVRQINNRISVDGIQIRTNGSLASTVRASSVTRIDVLALDGNDLINLNSGVVQGQQHIGIPARIWGHDGHDTIHGGSGNDKIWGGNDRDTIYGHRGNDEIWGGDGADDLFGGNHDADTLDGGDGDDTLWGENGNDTLYGGRGNDKLYGGNGDDTLNGNEGNDKLYGGNGDDTLNGNEGNDRLYGGHGTDKLDGGAGHDALFGGGGPNSRNVLVGGTGRDRFLTQTGDIIRDGNGLTSRTGEDAQVMFINREASWSNREVEVVDEALQELFDARGDNKLLKETQTGPSWSDPRLKFIQDRHLPDNADGYNKIDYYQVGCTTSGPWWNRKETCDYRSRFLSREIVFREWSEGNDTENQTIRRTVWHEIAHNYDRWQINSAIWNDFLKVSGWVQSPTDRTGLRLGKNFSSTSTFGNDKHYNWYRRSNSVADFARGYGGVNPYEDFATTWEHYFANGRSTSLATANNNANFRAKLRLIDQMVRLA